MSELSNAVTVLIARMESHPEDFGPGNKFAGVADALYGMLGLVQDIPRSAYWFLTDADKEALTEAWKKYHRTRMEKEVMEKIFDDGAEERELEMARIKMRQQAYQNQISLQNARMRNSAIQNAASTGLLGSGGNAAQNMFGMATNSSTTVRAGSFTIGNETIDESLITKLKKWVEEK